MTEKFGLIGRNRTMVDGTGAALYVADVAIKDGKIAAIGKCDGAAHKVIDVEGKLVTPRFFDIHTHFDAP